MNSDLQLEYYAVCCLAHFYHEFNDWVKSESPDFVAQSGDWGLEVTRALDEKETQYCNSMIARYKIWPVKRSVRKQLQPYIKQGLYAPCENVKVAWEKKCKLLCRPHFRKLSSNQLVVLSPLDHFLKQDIEEFSAFLKDEHENTSRLACFDVVYIISFENVLKFDVRCGTFEVQELSRTLHYSIMVKAAQMASP